MTCVLLGLVLALLGCGTLTFLALGGFLIWR